MSGSKNKKKEQISSAYIRVLAAKLGFNVSNYDYDDDSIDVSVAAKGQYGECYSPKVDFQLKCTSSIAEQDGVIKFVVKRKNYDDLRGNTLAPKYLVVCVVDEDCKKRILENDDNVLIYIKAYWYSLFGLSEINQGSKTLDIPNVNVFSADVLDVMMKKSPARLENVKEGD